MCKILLKIECIKSDSHLQKTICICISEGPLKMMENAFYFI